MSKLVLKVTGPKKIEFNGTVTNKTTFNITQDRNVISVTQKKFYDSTLKKILFFPFAIGAFNMNNRKKTSRARLVFEVDNSADSYMNIKLKADPSSLTSSHNYEIEDMSNHIKLKDNGIAYITK